MTIRATFTNITSHIVCRVLWSLSKANHLWGKRTENVMGSSKIADGMKGQGERSSFGRSQGSPRVSARNEWWYPQSVVVSVSQPHHLGVRRVYIFTSHPTPNPAGRGNNPKENLDIIRSVRLGSWTSRNKWCQLPWWPLLLRILTFIIIVVVAANTIDPLRHGKANQNDDISAYLDLNSWILIPRPID